MDKSMIKGALIGSVVMVAVGASGVTGYQAYSAAHSADVLAVAPVKEKVRTPHEECRDVPVRSRAPVQDQHRVAGTVIGGVIGGLVGNQFGGGSGNTLATVAGAAAGGYAGNTIQKQMQDQDGTTTMQSQCRTVYSTSEKIAAYDVTYRLNGKEGRVRMDHDPGKKIPVRHGELVLEKAERMADETPRPSRG